MGQKMVVYFFENEVAEVGTSRGASGNTPGGEPTFAKVVVTFRGFLFSSQIVLE
jgi:hypothetical protein